MAVKLTYNREDLVSKLNEALESRQAKRKEKQDKIAERNMEAKDRIVAMLDKYPEFLVFVNNCIEDEFGESAADADLEKILARSYSDREGLREDAPDPDVQLKRLITVYESASSDTIELEETEAVLNYLI